MAAFCALNIHLICSRMDSQNVLNIVLFIGLRLLSSVAGGLR